MGLFKRVKEFFNPFAGANSGKKLYLIRVTRFIVSLVFAAGLLGMLGWIGGFVYHSYFCGEDHSDKYLSSRFLPYIEITGIVSVNTNTEQEFLNLPHPAFSDPKSLAITSYLHQKYFITIYPSFSTPILYFFLLRFGMGLLLLASLFLLHELLYNISNRNFFLRKNFYYLRIIGVFSFSFSILNFILEKAIIKSFHLAHTIQFPSFWFDWKLGIIFFIIAEIFLAGISIKEDNDLTV